MRALILCLCLVISPFTFAQNEQTVETVPASAEPMKSTETAAEAKKESAERLNESEIALNLDKDKKAAESDNTLFRVLFSFSIIGILAGGAFYFLRKYAVPKGMKTQTQIKVLQQHYLGPKKSLAIVRVAGESILIGVTDQNINMIKSLSLLDDEVPEEIPQHFPKIAKGDVEAGDSEDFSFGGIKDVVARRLKGMRDLD